MFAAQQPSLTVARIAVRKVRRLPKDAPGAGGFVISHDAIIRYVTHEEIAAIAEPNGTLCPPHAGSQLLNGTTEQAILGKARVEDFDRSIWVTLIWLEIKGLGADALCPYDRSSCSNASSGEHIAPTHHHQKSSRFLLTGVTSTTTCPYSLP